MNTLKRSTRVSEPYVMQRRIGSTTYNVGIYFNPNAKEALDEKVRRLLIAEGNKVPGTRSESLIPQTGGVLINDLQNVQGNATIKPLQADWLSERGST